MFGKGLYAIVMVIALVLGACLIIFSTTNQWTFWVGVVVWSIFIFGLIYQSAKISFQGSTSKRLQVFEFVTKAFLPVFFTFALFIGYYLLQIEFERINKIAELGIDGYNNYYNQEIKPIVSQLVVWTIILCIVNITCGIILHFNKKKEAE